jgi:hypothetical protein
VLGGWQLTGINVVTSGVPIDLTYTASTNQVVSTTSSVYSLRPNLTSTPGAVYGHSLTKTNSSLNGYFVQSGVSVPVGSQLFGKRDATTAWAGVWAVRPGGAQEVHAAERPLQRGVPHRGLQSC